MKLTSKLLCTSMLSLFATISYAQNVGVSTSKPDSKLHVVATAADSVAFKVSIDNNTKMKVSSNGGVSIGDGSAAPVNGLLVKGQIQPEDSIKSAAKPIYITSVNDSVVLQAGNTTIILSANGAVRIKAAGGGGISIDAGNGDVNINGANINIASTNNTNIQSGLDASITAQSGTATLTASNGSATISGNAGATLTSSSGSALVKGVISTLQGSSQASVTGPIVRLGNSNFKPAARVGDVVSVSGSVGNIISGSAVVLIQ